jgi:hypothetical protein
MALCVLGKSSMTLTLVSWYCLLSFMMQAWFLVLFLNAMAC